MSKFGKTLKFLGNFIGIILSVVVSLALLVMLVATPMVSGFSAFTRPETITQLVQQVDFASIFLESFQDQMSEEQKKEMEFLTGLTETQAFAELIELYATDLTNAFEKKEKPSALTEEALRKIMNDNMAELIQIIRNIGNKAGENMDALTDAEIEVEVRKTFEEVVDRFLQMAPNAQSLRKILGEISESYTGKDYVDEDVVQNGMQFVEDDMSNEQEVTIIVGPDGTIQSGDGSVTYTVDPETGAIIINSASNSGQGTISANGFFSFGKPVAIQNSALRVLSTSVTPANGEQGDGVEVIFELAAMAKNGTLTLAMAGVIVILVLLICLLRWPRFKGLMWAAVILLIGAGLVAIAGAACMKLVGLYAQSTGISAGILSALDPVVKIIAKSMYTAAAIYAGVAIVLIVLFVVLRRVLKKKAAKSAEQAKEAIIEQIADEAQMLAQDASVEPEEDAQMQEQAAEALLEDEEEEVQEEVPAE